MKKRSKTTHADQFLASAYPGLWDVFMKIGHVDLPTIQTIPVAEAITKIIVGQMLSRSAAETIFLRILKKSQERGLHCWQLTINDLVGAGVSGRKARAIVEFGQRYDFDVSYYESWRNLDYLRLKEQVASHWGLSSWSADMLAIFYFGKKDVFPYGDGTIKKAMFLIRENFPHLGDFDPEKASPYKSYLSMYLWKMVDAKVL